MVLVRLSDDVPDFLARALDAVVDQDLVVLVRRQQSVAVLVSPLQPMDITSKELVGCCDYGM